MKLIGLIGALQSGKDTVYQTVAALEPPHSVLRVAFADALKDEVAHACGVTREFIEAHKPAFRPILQWWGTDFRRTFSGTDYWVGRIRATLDALPHLHPRVRAVFLTDVRFPNEAALVRDRGGQVVRVVRPGLQAPVSAAAHASETALAAWPVAATLTNAGTQADFQRAIARWWQAEADGPASAPCLH